MLFHTSTTSLSAEFSWRFRFGNRRLKNFSSWWLVNSDSASVHMQSLKHRERHSLLCFEPCIRQLMTKLQYFSWTDRLKLHLKGLKCFQECFGNLEKNNIYLPKVFHSPWLYLIHFSFWSKLIIQESLTRKFPNHYSEKLHVDWIPVKVHFFQKRN